MEIEVLGSGGAQATPRPGCACALCEGARRHGIPWARMGPCVFVHGPDVLIDTPEEARLLLDRAGIGDVAAVLYSHWHPDHTLGWRAIEALGADFRGWPPRPRPTDVYLPQRVAADFEERLGLGDAFRYLEARGFARVHPLDAGEDVVRPDVRIRPVALAAPGVYAFLLEADGARAFVAMDELVGWSPDETLCALDLDVAVLPTGVFEQDPFTGARRLHPDHPLLREEATWAGTLDVARRLGARQTVFLHVEESDGNDPDALGRLGERLTAEGLPATFAWDGLRIPVDPIST